MRIRPSWLVFGIAFAGAVATVSWYGLRGDAVHTKRAARHDLEQRIVASGRVWVPSRVQVAAQTPGLVVAVGAAEGQRVKTGDLLVQIDDAEERAAVAQSKAMVSQARARVDQLRKVGSIVANEALRQSESNAERALADFERTQKLAATGAVTSVELDNARRALDVARAQKNAAEAQQVSSAPLGADSRLALTALMQSQAQLAGSEARLAQTKIFALQNGSVLSRSVEPGDVVQPARTLLVLAADADTQLVFQPDERNLAWIKLGQKAKASADAFPADVFDAEVGYIAPSIDPQRGSVEVRLRVSNPPAFLRPDMTVSIDLAVASKKNVLTLPSDAIRDAATGAPWVFVVEGGRARRRNVVLGIRGEGTLEVISGLDEGTDVIVADGHTPKVGARVRAESD